MKLCPQCESGYSDRKSTCPIHGGLLTETGELPRGLLICGTYRILRKLGQGSMGTVYLVEHESAGELITLKFLNAELSGDESFTSRFERAAKRLSGLHHTNVLATGALERAEDDSLFFAMEYVDGPSLRELLNFAPAAFEPGLALAIARCVAEGLGAAHATGMVHLDLKPENILIAGDATLVPKIANFGIGATRENGSTFLAVGRILLTPTYAAPEQWRDTRSEQLDGRTDLYALGGILFEMLTGQTVFDAFGYHVWARQHLTVPPRKPSRLRPELAAWRGLDDLVRTLLAKSPDNRPKDAAAALALFDKVQFGAETIEIPKVRIVEPRKPIEFLRVQEALPETKPTTGSEATVKTKSAFTASLIEPVAGHEPVSTEEIPVSFSPAFADEHGAADSQDEPIAPEPQSSDPAHFATNNPEIEPAAAPETASEVFPPEFPVELTAPVTEDVVTPSEFEAGFSAPEVVEPELPTTSPDTEFVEAAVAPESAEKPLADQEPPQLSDFEFPPPAPEFVPAAEAEPVQVAEAELPATAPEPESVDAAAAPEPVDEPVVVEEEPFRLSDFEIQPPQPEAISPAETEPTPSTEAELPTTVPEPEFVDAAAAPEQVDEPVVAAEEPFHLSDFEIQPPQPEAISPAETEQTLSTEPELPTTFSGPEFAEAAAALEPADETVVTAEEPPHLSDFEFRPPPPEAISPAETEPTPSTEAEPPTTFPEPEFVEAVVAQEPADEPVVAAEEPFHLSDFAFQPPQPEAISPAETEPTPSTEAERPTTFPGPEFVEAAVAPEPVDEPVVAAEEPPHLSDFEFRPPPPEFIAPAKAEPVQAVEPELPIVFPEPEFIETAAAPEPLDGPVVAAEEPPHLSDFGFQHPQPESISLAEVQPVQFDKAEPAPVFTEPERVVEPVVAQGPPHLSEPEFPPSRPEFIPPPKTKRIPLSPEVLAALNAPEPVDEPIFVPEPKYFSDPKFPPFEPEFISPPQPARSPLPHHEPPPSFTASDPLKEPVITSARTRFFDRQFSTPAPEFLPPSTPEPEPFVTPNFSTFTAPKHVEPVIAPPRRSFASDFTSDLPEPRSTNTSPTREDRDSEESVMDVEELKRLFGRVENGVKPDDGPRRTTNTTSMFGPNSTGLGREEWPATAAPTNFFGKPYKPAGPEAPPTQVPEFPAAFSRTTKSDWIDTGKTAAPSIPEEEEEEVEEIEEIEEIETVQRVSHFPGTTFLQEIDYQEEIEEEPEEERHLVRTILIVVAAVLLLAAVGFAIWKLVINDANEPVTKMNAACAQGDGKACYDLGAFYEQTNTVSNGDERATVLYSQACELNFPLACRKLGLKYYLGTGIARDIPKAIELYTKGCDKADAESCDNLANIYHEGKDVPLDDAKAAVFYQKACATGDDFGCKWANQLAAPPPPTRLLPKRVTPAAAPHKAK